MKCCHRLPELLRKSKISTFCIFGLVLARARKPYGGSKKRGKPLPFQIMESGTTKGGLLCVADGFGHTRAVDKPRTSYWICRLGRAPRDGSTKPCKARGVLDKTKGQFFITVPHICDHPDFVLPLNCSERLPL